MHTDRKFGPVAKEHAPTLLIMLTNRPPMFLEEHEWRFFVAKWSSDIESFEGRAECFKGYRHWLDNGGYEAIAGILKTREVTEDIFEDTPITEEKKFVILDQFDLTVLAIERIPAGFEVML